MKSSNVEIQPSTHRKSSKVAATHRFSDRRVLKTGSRAGTRLSPPVKTSFQLAQMLSVGWIRQPTLNENGGVFVRTFLWLPLRRADVMRSRDGTRGQETYNNSPPAWTKVSHYFKHCPANGASWTVEPQTSKGATRIWSKTHDWKFWYAIWFPQNFCVRVNSLIHRLSYHDGSPEFLRLLPRAHRWD